MARLAAAAQRGGVGEFLRKNWANMLGALLSIATVAWMLRLLSSTTTESTAGSHPTALENAYQAVILTAASTFASWFIAKIHAQFSHDQSIRQIGTQVAQGIIVLTNQIDTLVQWIAKQPGPVRATPTDVEGTLDHIQESLRALRSMCILALGGMSDVIGGPLRRYELIQGQIGDLVDEQLEQTSVIVGKFQAVGPKDVPSLQKELAEVREKYEQKIAELSKMVELPVGVLVGAGKQKLGCPFCARENEVELRMVAGETALTTCSNCGKQFNAHVGAGGHIFARPTIVPAPLLPQAPQAALVEKALRRQKVLFKPAHALVLADLFASVDAEERQAHMPCTPLGLLAKVLHAAESKVPRPPDYRVHKFFGLIYRGELFRFPDGVAPSESAVYINPLDRDAILAKYLRSCLWRIWDEFTFGPDNAGMVGQLLLGPSYPNADTLVNQAFTEVLALRAKTPPAAGS